MLKNLSSLKTSLTVALLLATGLLFTLYTHLNNARTHISRDSEMSAIFDQIKAIRSYTEHVDTTATVSQRFLRVEGYYELAYEASSYRSYSTTSVTDLGNPRPAISTFTHQDIAIKDDVYLKIDTASPYLKKSIRLFPIWQHLKKDAIPTSLQDVAIAGPVQDNVALLVYGEKYFVPITSSSTSSSTSGDLHFTFKLDPSALETTSSSLKTLIDHVGRTGFIDIWASSSTHILKQIRFVGPDYVSTTTILTLNNPLLINPPSGSVEE